MKMTNEKLDLEKISDMDLASIVNQLEGLTWRINHDAGDGRISNEGVDESILELNQKKEQVVNEIKRRTGYTEFSQLKQFIGEKLKEQENIWDEKWNELQQEGSVFKISGGGRYKESPIAFETVRTYLPLRGTIGSNQYLMARVQGEFGTGRFRIFDDRDITELQKVDVKPMYKGQKKRGIVRYDEETDKRIELPFKRNWRNFCQSGLVFSHVGFDNVFETYGKFNLPEVEQEEGNEVILARPYNHDPVFYEFSKKDLGAMTLVPVEPKYHYKRDSSRWFHYADLDSEEKI
jgi:hypothetical protein